MSKEVQDYEIIEPPVQSENDDPRQVAYIPVSVITVDPNTQRPTTQVKVDSLGEVRWELMEMPTVTVRPDGEVVATEGQHRVLLVQQQMPDAHIWVVLNPGDNNEARIALAIAKSRKPLTPMDKWNLKLRDREPAQRKGEQVLVDLGLRLYNGGNVHDENAISAVGAVERVIAMGGPGEEGTDAGALLLSQTLAVLKAAFPGQPARFDGSLLAAVARLIHRNRPSDTFSGIRLQRLGTKLSQLPATKWLEKGLDRLPSQSKPRAIGKAIIDAYNLSLSPANEIRW